MASKELLQKLVDFYSRIERENAVKERFSIKSQLDKRLALLNEQVQCLSPSIQGDVSEHITAIEEMTGRLDEKFSLFVVGSGKVGKSTVINALIGDEVAKMKETAMTWRVDVFHEDNVAAKEARAEITYIEAEGTRKVLLPVEEAKARIVEEESKRETAMNQCHEKMQLVREKVKELPIKMRQEMIKEAQKQINEKYQYISPIIEVRWPLQGSEILKHFQIVDTPGLTQDLNKAGVQKSMTTYYKEADGILCVLDINKNCEKASFEQVEQIGETLHKQGVVFEKAQMLGVMNRCDELKEAEKIPMLIAQGKKIYEGMLQDIVPLSARQALETQMTPNVSEELLETSGIIALKEYIYQHFLQSSSSLRIDKTLQFVRSEEENIIRLVTNHRDMMKALLVKEQCLSHEFRKNIKDVGCDLEERMKLFLNKYENRVLHAIEEKTELLFTEGHAEKAYIEENIFMLPELKAGLMQLNKDIEEALIQLKAQYYTIILGDRPIKNSQQHNAEEVIQCIDISQIDFNKYLSFEMFGVLEQFQLVRSLVKRKRVKQCEQQLEEQFKALKRDIMEELIKGLETSVNDIEHQIDQMSKMRFRNYYADEIAAKAYIEHLGQIAKLLNEPIKKNTIVSYIKGEVYDEH